MSGEQLRESEVSETMTARVSQKAVVFDPRGRVLVLRDASNGEWEFPGGQIDRGERPVEAFRREMLEETGLTVDVDGPVFTATKRRRTSRAKFLVYYRCSVPDPTPEVRISDEHTAHRWVDPEAIPRMDRRRRAALARALADQER